MNKKKQKNKEQKNKKRKNLKYNIVLKILLKTNVVSKYIMPFVILGLLTLFY